MDQQLLLYTSISFIIILLAHKVFFQTKKRHYKNLPPSPPSYPIIGHLHLLKSPLHRTLHTLSSKYGDVFSLWLGSRRVVVVSSPSAVEECFTTNDIVFANRPRLLLGKYMAYNYTDVGNSPYGDHWRNLRRIGAIEIFSSKRLNLLAGIRRDEVERLLCKLSRREESEKVELKSALQQLTFNIVMRMLAGKRYYDDDMANEEEARKFRDVVEASFEIAEVGNPGDFLPFLNWIPNGYEKRVKRVAKRMDLLLQNLIDEHRSHEDKNRDTIIAHLLSLQESQPEYYTDEIIKGFVSVIISAGTHTTSATLEWAMSNLLNHPHVIEKLKVELDSQIDQHKLVEESDLSKLSYLQCVISETLRLYPVAPLLVPHYSSNDCTINGCDVPRDTILLVNAWAIHRDPKLWEDAESFKPERFKNIKGDIEGFKLMPFGLGRRACPGNGLAQRVMGLTLGSLIQCFDWERVGNEIIDMVEGTGASMSKVVSLEAMCKPCPIMKKLLPHFINGI
ncbi:cytochrome P450 81Q32-like [Humulus lupulus]|uniref:cytochrome P450 81Q32-like n=1 Tax=Humulus lupulus TaxID=3486 RepID=UPI002B417BD8|nr:cytochrome P450 81Q32-like [Humulus lupulus]